jgi:quercetin dioxygenase-like cupin family protein
VQATTDKLFVNADDLPWEVVGEGVRRQVLAYDAGLMLVKVAFEQGGVGARHQHPHVQMSYVESGVFEYTIEEETQTMRAGDTCYVPSNAWHSTTCLETGVLVDVFTPMREDFLKA